MIDKQTKSAGAAAVGGPLSLIDQDGKPFSSDQLKKEFSLLYFGFTQCPDICPDELDKISEAIGLIRKTASHVACLVDWLAEKQTGIRIQSVFITLDPERDHPKLVKRSFSCVSTSLFIHSGVLLAMCRSSIRR